MLTYIIEYKIHTIFWAEILVALPEDGEQHTETYRRNAVNIFLYKYICAFICYVWGVINENSRIGKNSEYW